MAGRVQRQHFPWLALAALVVVCVAVVTGGTLAGWKGDVSYGAVPIEQLPLPGSPALAGGTGDQERTSTAHLKRQAGTDRSLPASLAALDVLGLASIGSGVQRDPGATKPKVAILVVGIGLARVASESALSLPPSVGLAVSPYADTASASASAWIARVRAAGHEAFLMLPLETADPNRTDPGPRAVGPGLAAGERQANLGWLIERSSGSVGVAAEAGAYAAAPDGFVPVAQVLAGHGLGLVELAGAHLETAARTATLPFMAAEGALDAVPAAGDIDLALGQLEAQALRSGKALGWAHSHPISFSRLVAWLPTLAGKGLSLVPVSALLAEADRLTATR